MKKIYQIPTTTVMNVELQQMIAESINMGGSYGGGAILSRQGSAWDDDDDEE